MSTTTLPKISPISTPVPTKCPRTLSASLSTNSFGPYPPRELSTSMELVRIPQRINPLSPPPPKKRINMAWETVDQHWHNEARRIMMQQREHQRYHSAWSKPFYGQPAEKEQYRYVGWHFFFVGGNECFVFVGRFHQSYLLFIDFLYIYIVHRRVPMSIKGTAPQI